MITWMSAFARGGACALRRLPGVRSASRACRKARRAGDRQRRLQERPEAAEGGQRRPHHGRYAEAARLYRDGRREPDPAGFARRCWRSTRRSSRATPRSSSMPATASRSRARIFCCRPTCRRRPRARKNWCAMPRCSPTASSIGCRTRGCAPPSSCSTPAATIRSSARHARGGRRRRACADDAIAGRRVLGLLGRAAADRARSPVQRRRQPEFGVHPHLREGADCSPA